MRQARNCLSILRILLGLGKVCGCGVGAWAEQTNDVGQVKHAIVVGVHLVYEHEAVGLAHHQLIVSEENNQVQCVNLHPSALVDSLEGIHYEEAVLLTENQFLEFCLADAHTLLSDDAGDHLLGPES